MNDEAPIRINLGFVNAWLLRAGEAFVLVDSGLAIHRRRLGESLRAAGCAPGKLRLHVLTHPDFDHAGNSAWLRSDWGAPVAIHEADAGALESGILPARRGIGAFAWLLTLSQAVPRRGPGCPVDIRLVDGQSLEAWGLRATVHHLPGHTAGSLGVLLPAGFFIAGDLVSNWRKPGPGLLAADFAAYRRSLDRARELVPVGGMVYPGHGAAFNAAALADIRI